MAELLRSLLHVSEKAANVARICRKEAPLFQLLVQEKTGDDKTKKFLRDFKTLADVVIQEMIRHDLVAQFPQLTGFIYGEESNKFENGLGESIQVTVCSCEEDTAALLATVLDGHQEAADLLAQAIHQDLQLTDEAAESLELLLCPSEVAIWIDPIGLGSTLVETDLALKSSPPKLTQYFHNIDGTSQYIEGREVVVPEEEVCPSGLHCALVLIGVYLRATGEPVMGVINQPFAGQGLKGQHFWGVSFGNIKASSISSLTHRSEEVLSIVLSSSEKQNVKDALSPLCGGKVKYVSGAGYKILCVILGLADAYVLSEGSTYKWDSCAPHAILRALGGGIVDLAECIGCLQENEYRHTQLTYHQPKPGSQGAERWANHGGLVAYLDSAKLKRVIGALSGKV